MTDIGYCQYNDIEVEYFKSCMKNNTGKFSKYHYDKLLTKLREMAFSEGLSRPSDWYWFIVNKETVTKGIFKKREDVKGNIVMKLRFNNDLTPQEIKIWKCILETLRLID